ncbi:MAG: hypothetical protein H0T21_06925 [Gemmatimonadaceae bacterium]|nr:hypothetical protein [Gemmatimonadaceae bacterium]
MTFNRRLSSLTALVSSVFLIATMLVTSGFACVLPSAGQAMAGMDMSGATGEMASMSATHDAPAVSIEGLSPESEAPCRFPWAPGGCGSSMAPCGPAAVTSVAVAVNSVVRPESGTREIRALEPPSEVTAPELPPPRA